MKETKFKVGQSVRKVGGTYEAKGRIAGIAETSTGETRYVFEFKEPAGMLHIFNESQLMAMVSGAATKVTDEMVGRFLAWKLPQDFAPDCHISFNRQAALASQPANWPVGTNLLHAGQVRDMLDHVLGAAAPASFQDRVRAEAAELDERIDKLAAFLPSDTFSSLPKEEQDRLTAQLAAMQDYSGCLAERIGAFGGAA